MKLVYFILFYFMKHVAKYIPNQIYIHKISKKRKKKSWGILLIKSYYQKCLKTEYI